MSRQTLKGVLHRTDGPAVVRSYAGDECWLHGVKVDEALICTAAPDHAMARMKADNMGLQRYRPWAETDPYGFKSQIVEVADVIRSVASDPSSAPFEGAGDEDTTALVGFYHHGFIVAQYRNFEDFGDGFYSGAILARDIAERSSTCVTVPSPTTARPIG